jgi:hypothetical protein
MPLETPTLFSQVIQDHLDLKRRNAELERNMPLDRYKSDDPFHNHPLFKSEEQARLEETMDGQLRADDLPLTVPVEWPSEESPSSEDVLVGDGLWSRSRDFDWGD